MQAATNPPRPSSGTVSATSTEMVERFMKRLLDPAASPRDELFEALRVLGETLQALDEMQRACIGAGLKYLVEHPEQTELVADSTRRLVHGWGVQ